MTKNCHGRKLSQNKNCPDQKMCLTENLPSQKLSCPKIRLTQNPSDKKSSRPKIVQAKNQSNWKSSQKLVNKSALNPDCIYHATPPFKSWMLSFFDRIAKKSFGSIQYRNWTLVSVPDTETGVWLHTTKSNELKLKTIQRYYCLIFIPCTSSFWVLNAKFFLKQVDW